MFLHHFSFRGSYVIVSLNGGLMVYDLVHSGCSGGRVVSMSASHQCGPGSIPGWGSDPGAVSEKGFVPV